jgi:hypothetical protein
MGTIKPIGGTFLILLANPDSYFSPQTSIYIMENEFSSQLSAIRTYGNQPET